MKYLLTLSFLFIILINSIAQTENKIRPLKPEEYKKAKTFIINDLDNDTYIKFENKYVLDRYAMRKPYFITGDDGLKKRVDLYTLYAKDSMQQIGTVIFYTNENKKIYTAVMPSFPSDTVVWNAYFNDIDNINKEEKNYILKVSYILSREFNFQVYKSLNKNVKDEDGTYGMDICFPGDQLVSMADGTQKLLKNIKAGDAIITVDASKNKPVIQQVKELVSHAAKNYAITTLYLLHADEKETTSGYSVHLSNKIIKATPNHPIQTTGSKKNMGSVTCGEEILCLNESSKKYEPFIVYNIAEHAGAIQPVYNMVVTGGENFMINDVIIKQK